MPRIVADLSPSDDGHSPSIAYARGALPSIPTFFVVVPPGGSEEAAKLFALCAEDTPDRDDRRLRAGRRRAAPLAYAVDAIDPEAVPRLFERGAHPGDLRLVDAPRTRLGEDRTAALAFVDLSRGLSSTERLTLTWDRRLALARACEEERIRTWKAAADLFDPAGLMRNGAVPPDGGLPVGEAFGRFMQEGAARENRRIDAVNHPMRDFRLLRDAELPDEIQREARAVLYGCSDLPPDGPATDLLKGRIDEFAEALRADGDAETAHMRLQTALAYATAPGHGSQAVRRLTSGVGPGAVCWRNLFAPEGLVATAMRRRRAPETARQAESAAELPSWARRAVLDPASVLAARPRTVEQAAGMLGDSHRPYLALPAARLAASPALLATLAAMPSGHAEAMLANNALLVVALEEIENRHPWTAAARDAAAIGWHALVKTVAEFDPDLAESLSAEAPAFLTPEAAALPFLSSEADIHRRIAMAGGPRL